MLRSTRARRSSSSRDIEADVKEAKYEITEHLSLGRQADEPRRRFTARHDERGHVACTPRARAATRADNRRARPA
jgi:hypothetical protein